MSKIKLTVDATNIEQVFDLSEVHYRIIYSNRVQSAVVVCVQDFDYFDYPEFITEIAFAIESDAEKVAKKINKIGVKHFR